MENLELLSAWTVRILHVNCIRILVLGTGILSCQEWKGIPIRSYLSVTARCMSIISTRHQNSFWCDQLHFSHAYNFIKTIQKNAKTPLHTTP